MTLLQSQKKRSEAMMDGTSGQPTLIYATYTVHVYVQHMQYMHNSVHSLYIHHSFSLYILIVIVYSTIPYAAYICCFVLATCTRTTELNFIPYVDVEFINICLNVLRMLKYTV